MTLMSTKVKTTKREGQAMPESNSANTLSPSPIATPSVRGQHISPCAALIQIAVYNSLKRHTTSSVSFQIMLYSCLCRSGTENFLSLNCRRDIRNSGIIESNEDNTEVDTGIFSVHENMVKLLLLFIAQCENTLIRYAVAVGDGPDYY